MKKRSDDTAEIGFSFDMSPEEFDKRLQSELQSVGSMNDTFSVLNDLNPSPMEKVQAKKVLSQTMNQTFYPEIPSSSSSYVLGKTVPSSISMLPQKFVRHDENSKRIYTAKTAVSNISTDNVEYEEIDPEAFVTQFNDPSSDVNYNSNGNNVFVLSCNSVTNMPVVPRESSEGVPLTTPQLRKHVNDRYAEIHSLFTPPTTLTQHDVDVLNITIEAKRYEDYYQSSSSTTSKQSFDSLAIQHEYELQRHVERLRKPKEHVPFGSTSPLPHVISKSAGSSLSPIKRRKNKQRSQDVVEPFSDSEKTTLSPINYTTPINRLEKMHQQSKSPRSPVLTVDNFNEVADKMKDDIKSLVQDTIRNELMNMRKKQSRGGILYVEPVTPTNSSFETTDNNTGGQRRRSQQPTRPVQTPDGIEQVIERKIELKLQKLNDELVQLKNNQKPKDNSPKNSNVVKIKSNDHHNHYQQQQPHSINTSPTKIVSPVRPPVGNGFSPKVVNNKGRKLVIKENGAAASSYLQNYPQESDDYESSQAMYKSTGGNNVSFQEDEIRSAYAVTEVQRNTPARKLSGVSVTFSSASPTPVMSAAPPHSSGYLRNFSHTPGGSLIHSFIDENREYAGAAYDEYDAEKRRASIDFVSVGTPAGPNLFGTTPATARLSSPMFSAEFNPPLSPDGRVGSPRGNSRGGSRRQSGSFDKQLIVATSPAPSRRHSQNIVSQATPPDHIDARATDVTIQVIAKTESPTVDRKRSVELNPNLKVKIDGVVLDANNNNNSTSKKSPGGRKGSTGTRKDSDSGELVIVPVKQRNDSMTKTEDVKPVSDTIDNVVEENKVDQRLMFQKVNVNEVTMAPLNKDVVQPMVLMKNPRDRTMSVGTVARHNESKELVASAVLAATSSVTSVLVEPSPVDVKSVSAPTVTVAPAVAPAVVATVSVPPVASPPVVVNNEIPVKEPVVVVNQSTPVVAVSKPTDVKSDPAVVAVKKVEEVVVVPVSVVRAEPLPVKPIIADTTNTTVAAVINGKPLNTLKSKETPPTSTPKEETNVVVPPVAVVRDAILSAAGLGSRGKTADIMAQYDREQQEEEESNLFGTGYANTISSKIMKRFEPKGPPSDTQGIEVDMSDQKLSESEVAVLDSEYNELTKQITQLSKIKSKIKKDLKVWVSDFEVKAGRPPSTADKLEIEDRFLAYKTVVTEVEEAKRYSNKIAELLRSSR